MPRLLAPTAKNKRLGPDQNSNTVNLTSKLCVDRNRKGFLSSVDGSHALNGFYIAFVPKVNTPTISSCKVLQKTSGRSSRDKNYKWFYAVGCSEISMKLPKGFCG